MSAREHFDMVKGQTVHCERASFFATPSVPIDPWGRIMFGVHIGFGLAFGCIAAVGLIVVAGRAWKAIGL